MVVRLLPRILQMRSKGRVKYDVVEEFDQRWRRRY